MWLLDTNVWIAYLNKKPSPVKHRIARLGTPIGPYDLQIAAIARVHNVILITHNIAEFFRVPELTVEDWES